MTCPHEINVLALNIWLRPLPFIDGQRQRLRLFEPYLRGVDVLILYQAYAKTLIHQLFVKLQDEYSFQTLVLDPPSTSSDTRVHLHLWNGGVVIFSRWPIETIDSCSFRGMIGHPDLYANKGALYAAINKEGQRYHLFGTHTQAEPLHYVDLTYRLFGRSAHTQFLEYRLAQFNAIRRFIERQHISSNEPVILAGNFNTDRLHQPRQFDMMLERLNACTTAASSEELCTRDPLNNPLARGSQSQWLDNILWSRVHLQPQSCHLSVCPLFSEESWRRHRFGRRYHHLSGHYALRGHLCFPSSSR
jgi:hypothetical protein